MDWIIKVPLYILDIFIETKKHLVQSYVHSKVPDETLTHIPPTHRLIWVFAMHIRPFSGLDSNTYLCAKKIPTYEWKLQKHFYFNC